MKRWLAILALGASACAKSAAAPTAADAKTFLDTVNQTTLKLGIEQGRAGWVQQTYITDDTEALSARATQAAVDAGVRFAKESTKYDRVGVSAEERRELTLLKTSLVLATPADPKESDELTTIAARLESTYGKGKWCPGNDIPDKPAACQNIDDITKTLATSRDPAVQRAAWEGGHTIAPPMRKGYVPLVELSNQSANELR